MPRASQEDAVSFARDVRERGSNARDSLARVRMRSAPEWRSYVIQCFSVTSSYRYVGSREPCAFCRFGCDEHLVARLRSPSRRASRRRPPRPSSYAGTRADLRCSSFPSWSPSAEVVAERMALGHPIDDQRVGRCRHHGSDDAEGDESEHRASAAVLWDSLGGRPCRAMRELYAGKSSIPIARAVVVMRSS